MSQQIYIYVYLETELAINEPKQKKLKYKNLLKIIIIKLI